MGIRVSEETKKRTRHLSYDQYISNFTEVSLANMEAIIPRPGRKLPCSIWFVNKGFLYEFLTPKSYTDKVFNQVLGLARRHVDFKLFVKSAENVALLRFVEECRQPTLDLTEQILKEEVADVKQKAQQVLSAIPDMNITPEIAEAAKGVVRGVVTSILKDQKVTSLLTKLLEMDGAYLDHAVAVSMIGSSIGKALGLSPQHLTVVAMSGVMHDIGQFKLPSRILGPDKDLTGDELELYKTHTALGQEMLDDLGQNGLRIPQEVEVVAMQHHERFNGCGYPNRKRGRQEEEGSKGIHLYARIIGLADRYVDLIEKAKENKQETTQAELLARLFKQDGAFDPVILEKFKKIIKEETK